MNKPNSVPNPLAPHERTVPALLKRQAALFGAKTLLTIGDTTWRHDQAAAVAAGRAGALKAAGVEQGDRVAIMCSNRIEFLDVFLGCGWIGAAAVPVNTASMGPQIAYLIGNSGARLLVIEDEFVERVALADLSHTGLKTIWVIGAAAVPGSIAGVPAQACPAASDAIEAADVLPSDPLAIMYTSGTTGPAKGVICPHAQYYWWGVNSAHVLSVGREDVLCTTLPLFHINALNTYAQAAIQGARVIFLARFSASGFWAAMQASQATVVYLLGAMVPILLAQAESGAERSHAVRTGIGPGVPAAAGAAFERRTGIRLLEGYGSTESNFVIATDAGTPRDGTMGRLLPGFAARVVDQHDVELDHGVAGELVLRADQPFAFSNGYFGMPDKTVEAWRNLWFHTGDRVIRDANGNFRFIDRIKDAIRRRGENISSYEVEQVLQSHQGVASVAVYPVGSQLAEDEVMASVIAHGEVVLDLAELAHFCESRLPYFAIPRYFDVVTELPRTENGKIQKYKLRERGVTDTTWDRQPDGRKGKPAA